MKSWMSACLIAGMLGVGITSCSEDNDPIEQVDEALDCSNICDRYKDCFDDNYDVDKCEDRCQDRADDPDHRNQEEKCSDCLDGQSCGGSVFSCTDDCLGIVP